MRFRAGARRSLNYAMPTHPTEEATVRAFIIPTKRERYAAMLGNPGTRAKFFRRGGLDHCHDFDPRYATALPSKANVPELLRSHGAPATCHVISSNSGIDGREMSIEDALGEAQGSGTLLCCVPGRLACDEGEDGEQRLLLRRTPGASRLAP